MRSSLSAEYQSCQVSHYNVRGNNRRFILREGGTKKKRSSLNGLSDTELLASLMDLRKTETKTVLSMLLHLIEVEARGLDLVNGFRSLFDFCIRRLKYSESVAIRRIRTARAIRIYPYVYDSLLSGRVTVCNVSKISGLLTKENHRRLLDRIAGRSTREVDMLVASYRPATKVRDRIIPIRVLERDPDRSGSKAGPDLKKADLSGRSDLECSIDESGGRKLTASAGGKNPCSMFGAVSGTGRSSGADTEPARVEGSFKQKFKLQFAVSHEFMAKYERVKELLSTKHPRGMDFECVFERMLDEYIDVHSPEGREKRRVARERARKKKENLGKSRERYGAGRGKSRREIRTEASDKGEAEASGKGGAEALDKGEAPISKADTATRKSRYIPMKVRDEIYRRDGGCCAYRSPDGRKCGSKWNLEVDHIIPFACGGTNDPGNLQLLCRKHNQQKGISVRRDDSKIVRKRECISGVMTARSSERRSKGSGG